MELDDTYVEDCRPEPCSNYVRWFDVLGPIETAMADTRSKMEASGISVQDRSAYDWSILVGRTDAHIFFAVFGTEKIAGNEFAPEGADAEISVMLLPEE